MADIIAVSSFISPGLLNNNTLEEYIESPNIRGKDIIKPTISELLMLHVRKEVKIIICANPKHRSAKIIHSFIDTKLLDAKNIFMSKPDVAQNNNIKKAVIILENTT